MCPLVIGVFTIILLSGNGQATLVVDKGGGGDYTSIQAAIDNATAGETIIVNNARYYENILVNKSVTLIGQSNVDTIVDGSDAGHGFHITSDNVTLRMFRVDNCMGSDNKAVYVQGCHDVYIKDFDIMHSWYNLYVVDSDYGYYQDIYHYSSWGTTVIARNMNHSVFRNHYTSHSDFGYGILLDDSFFNLIDGSTSNYHSCGIYLSGSCNNTLLYNHVEENNLGMGVFEIHVKDIHSTHHTRS